MAWYRPWEAFTDPKGHIEEIWKKSPITWGIRKTDKELKRIITPPPMPLAPSTVMSPAPKAVLAAERAESIADRLKKRKRYRTAMGGGYGELNLSQAGLLGV